MAAGSREKQDKGTAGGMEYKTKQGRKVTCIQASNEEVRYPKSCSEKGQGGGSERRRKETAECRTRDQQNGEAKHISANKPWDLYLCASAILWVSFVIFVCVAGHLKKKMRITCIFNTGILRMKSGPPLHECQLGTHSSTGRRQCKE